MKYMAAIALLVGAHLATAQVTPLADTLDWRSYYPLQVGNVWEYQHMEEPPTDFSRESVVGDTLANGWQYFKIRHERFNDDLGGLFSSRVFYVRYDSTGTVVSFDDVTEDTTRERRPGGAIHPSYDLRSAFGDTVRSSSGEILYWTEGGYASALEISGHSYEVAALKRFVSLTWWESYASGIGLLGGGNLWGRHLIYARVAGKDYGSSRIDTGIESNPGEASTALSMQIYPVPATEQVRVDLALGRSGSVSWELFTVAGQRLWHHQSGWLVAGTHQKRINTSGLASGVYVVRVVSGAGARATGRMVIAE